MCTCRFVNTFGRAGSGLSGTQCHVWARVHFKGAAVNRATEFVIIELPAIGKAQSSYGSCHATFLACFCFGEEENVSGSREKKLQSTGNSGWLVCAAVLDCSHLLLIVAIGIAHAMLAMQCKAHPQCCAFL